MLGDAGRRAARATRATARGRSAPAAVPLGANPAASREGAHGLVAALPRAPAGWARPLGRPAPPGGVSAHAGGGATSTRARASARGPGVDVTAQLLSARSPGDLEGALAPAVAAGKIPEQTLGAVLALHAQYEEACLQDGLSVEDASGLMGRFVSLVLAEMRKPTPFSPQHERLSAPLDYYAFGQAWTRPLIDLGRSLLGGVSRWREVRDALARGENAILLTNHQSEADPAVIAWMLARRFPSLATDCYYVAGDRVVTDPMAVPFSLGRNLFCVHSKRHINDDPRTKGAKEGTNRAALRAMRKGLKKGGLLVWVAPSGGRDRTLDVPREVVGAGRGAAGPVSASPAPVSFGLEPGFRPDPFDAGSVDLMRTLALASKHGPVTRIWPLAMRSYAILAPPRTVEKALGEARTVRHSPVGISLGPELDLGLPSGDGEGSLTAVAETATNSEFDKLSEALYDPDTLHEGFVRP